MPNKIVKESEIKIRVGLDDKHNPVRITWEASDSGEGKETPVKAFLLSLWDEKENNSMRIDLWNQEFNVEEMRQFVYQNLISMGEALARATGDEDLKEDMFGYAAHFAKNAGLIR